MEGLAKALKAARTALALDPNLAAAHSALGNAIWSLGDATLGEREMLRATELNPGYVYGHQQYGELLAWTGRETEAIAAMRRAQEIDPLWVSPTTVDLAYLYALRGDDELAEREWARALELAPAYSRTHKNLGNYYCGKGRYERGLEALERALELSPDDSHITADIGHCYAISGRAAEARRLLAELEETGRTRYVSPMAAALIYVGLEENDEAFRGLERAREIQAIMLASIHIDRRYHRLGSDPRFADLLRELGLPSLPDSSI